jgi:hypothetical protein
VTRNYLDAAQKRYKSWRRWQAAWQWINTSLGILSTGLASVVALNTQAFQKGKALFSDEVGIGLAVAVPALTFLFTTLRPQAETMAFRTAARELEKAMNEYEGNDAADDQLLVGAINRGIDLLNKAQ